MKSEMDTIAAFCRWLRMEKGIRTVPRNQEEIKKLVREFLFSPENLVNTNRRRST